MEKIIPETNREISRLDEYTRLKGPIWYLVALGHNWDRSGNSWENKDSQAVELSLPSKITAVTSYFLLKKGYVEKVIFSGGKTAGPEQSSEAKAMLNYLETVFGHANVEDLKPKIILEENSYSTHSNMWESGDLMQRNSSGGPLDNIGLMSIGYHMDIRAESIANANKMPIDISLHSDNLLRAFIAQSSLQIEDRGDIDNVSDIEQLRTFSIISNLISDYDKYLKSPFYITNTGKIKMEAHTPVYHQLAKIFQIILFDSTGEKADRQAKKRLQKGNI